MRAGMGARIDAANAAGGVYGRQISYEWDDDRGKLETNSSIARTLIEDRKVFAIMETSPASTGGASYLASNRIPVVGMAAEPVWTQYRNMFSFTYNQSALKTSEAVNTFGKFTRSQGGTRALVISDPVGLGLPNVSTRQMQTSLESAGIHVSLAKADQDPSAAQLNDIVHEMTTGHVDTLVGALTTETFAKIIAAVRRRGLHPKVLLSGGQPPDADLLATFGPLLAGLTTYTSQPLDPSNPAVGTYQANMRRYSPELEDSSQLVALTGYITADLLIRGLQAAGPCPTRQSFITGLRAVKNYTAGGLTPPVDFEADFGKVPACYPFTSVNTLGNGLITVSQNFCGEPIGR
ncbi:ABC transporter substrate-binding protein [Frankia sp. R82]|uniref:ABC transporter substrate-binding protein n=1 Tax=Frankia sp. R82 TaxID=2950553 RepID=UPI0020441B0B|nr:ABC transporter substrate-binding protein [Frankia sp. R82]MCM3883250.1 ABC transporter substrate-binding protein [Frankia sp. R82]